jgi:S1-C subfamily serine protease
MEGTMPAQVRFGAQVEFLTIDGVTQSGASILSVKPGGLAAKLNLQPNDVVLVLNNIPLNSVDDVNAFNATNGATISVVYKSASDGKLHTATGTVVTIKSATFGPPSDDPNQNICDVNGLNDVVTDDQIG